MGATEIAVVTFALVVALEAGRHFLGLRDAPIGFAVTLSFALPLTVIVVLFDHIHTVYTARCGMTGGAPPAPRGEVNSL